MGGNLLFVRVTVPKCIFGKFISGLLLLFSFANNWCYMKKCRWFEHKPEPNPLGEEVWIRKPLDMTLWQSIPDQKLIRQKRLNGLSPNSLLYLGWWDQGITSLLSTYLIIQLFGSHVPHHLMRAGSPPYPQHPCVMKPRPLFDLTFRFDPLISFQSFDSRSSNWDFIQPQTRNITNMIVFSILLPLIEMSWQ